MNKICIGTILILCLTVFSETLPIIELETITVFTVSTPKANGVTTDVPQTKVVKVEAQTADVVETPVQTADVVETPMVCVNAETTKTPEAKGVTISQSDVQMNSFLSSLRDSRSFFFAQKMTKQWIDVSKQVFPEIDFIQLNKRKIISHVQLPVNDSILIENLLFYKSKKYDGVLLSFTTDDVIEELIRVASLIKNNGFKLYIAINEEPFKNIEKLKIRIEKLSPLSEGMFLGYMKSYTHNHLTDQWYLQYISSIARNANKNIAIIGECFVGEIQHEFNRKENNTIKNVSGTLLVNSGYFGIPVKKAVKIWDVYGEPIPLIIGFPPYYTKKGITDEQAFFAKNKIEKRWENFGVKVTVTLHGDGEPQNDNIGSKKLLIKK